jgi:hypothetical protein
MEIMKQTDEIRVETEEEAKALIEDFKQKALENGYEIASYSSTKKDKKLKGEVVDEWVVVKIVKKWA